ncbi:MAG: hypothetical protein QF717_16110 [SAR202 cluster bacterium]|nr:hypothetical protein [SAR202 cluster bacterium]MDP7226842.1 hypothetical protein [SAR202 cluster bacterium]
MSTSSIVGRIRQSIHHMGLLPRLLIAETIVFGMLFAGGIVLVNHMTDSLRDSIRQDRLLPRKVIAEDLDATIEHEITDLRQLAEGYRQTLALGVSSSVPEDLELLRLWERASMTTASAHRRVEIIIRS